MAKRRSTAGPVSTRVVTAVARELGVDPTDLPPLEGAVDADALNALVDPDHGTNGHDTNGSGDCTVQFSYADVEVHVRDGEVRVLDTS